MYCCSVMSYLGFLSKNSRYISPIVHSSSHLEYLVVYCTMFLKKEKNSFKYCIWRGLNPRLTNVGAVGTILTIEP